MQAHLCLCGFMNKCICAFVSFMNICKRDFKPTEMVCCIFGSDMLRPKAKVGRGKVRYEDEMRDKSRPLIEQSKLLSTKNFKNQRIFPKEDFKELSASTYEKRHES